MPAVETVVRLNTVPVRREYSTGSGTLLQILKNENKLDIGF